MKTIGLFNPSSPVYTDVDLKKLETFFQKKGFHFVQSQNLWQKNRFLAGTDEQRASDIMDLFCDDNIDVLLAFRGGYGSMRVLDLLDYDLIKKHKKPVIGFSDTTALELALWAKAGIESLTGFLANYDVINPEKTDLMVDKTFDLAMSGASLSTGVVPMNDACCDIGGTLIGGTLTLIEKLLGTPFCPDFKDCLLFIEDVGEEPYKVDAMLSHLRLAGVFEKVKGVIFGRFNKCTAEDKNDGTMEDVINDLCMRCPNTAFWKGLPYGHIPSRIILPIGAHADIKDNILSFSYSLS